MARRRDDDDEDDDDFDDRPSRKSGKKEGGGGKTVIIVVGIIALVILIIVGGCAGLIWYGVSSAKKSVSNTVSLFEATAEGDSFLFKLSSDPQTAYDSTSAGFKTSMSRDSFQQLLNRNPVLTKSNTHRMLTTNTPTGTAPNRKVTISYEVTKFGEDFEPWTPPNQPKPTKAAPGPRTVNVTLTLAEQSAGFWKVDGITVP